MSRLEITARCGSGLSLAALLVMAGFPGSAAAVEWRLSKGIGARASTSLQEARSSTLDDAGVDADEDEESVRSLLGLSTFLTLNGTGRRSQLALQANLEIQRVIDDDATDETNYRRSLGASSRTILVERLAVFDADARVSRRSVDGNPLNDGDAFLDERTDDEVREFSLGPTISNRISDVALYQADYRFSAVRSADETQVGSNTHSVSSRVIVVAGANGPYFFVGGTHEQSNFENDDSARSGVAGVGVAYRLRPRLVGAVVVGRDWARAGEAAEATEDDFWSVNLRWQPNRRIIATAGYAERSFGRRPQASVQWQGRRSSVELSWSRELSFATRGSESLTSLSFVDAADGESVGIAEPDTPTVAPQIETTDDPLAPFANDAFAVQENVELGYQLSGRVTTLGVSMTYFEREQRNIDEKSDGRELSLQLSRTVSRRLSVSASAAVANGRNTREEERGNVYRAELSARLAL